MAELAVDGDARGPKEVADCPPLGDLLAHGIDDLTKFQILTFLCHRPEASGDARFFARSLGLWSAERTEVALAEMAAAGLLERRRDDGGGVAYGLPPDSGLGRQLCTTCIFGAGGEWHRALLAHLAARSLRRTVGRGRRRAIGRGEEAAPAAPTI